jgi:hypothetical protein
MAIQSSPPGVPVLAREPVVRVVEPALVALEVFVVEDAAPLALEPPEDAAGLTEKGAENILGAVKSFWSCPT